MGKKIGVIGGTGKVGLEVVKYLLENTEYEILVGSRNKPNLDLFKASSNVSHFKVDVHENGTLDKFCSECRMIINCAGPSWLIVDKIASFALKYGIDYVDTGGYQPLYAALEKKKQDIVSKNLTFIVAAGLLPGISGILSNYLASNFFDNPKTYEVYYAVQDKWTFNSAYDIISSMGVADKFGPLIYENNSFKKANFFSMSRKVDLPEPFGKKRMFRFFTPEMDLILNTHNFDNLTGFTIYNGKNISKTLGGIKFFKRFKTHEEKQNSAFKLVNAAEKDLADNESRFLMQLNITGFFKNLEKKASLIFSIGDTYKLTGMAAACAGVSILEEKAGSPGWRLLAGIEDCNWFAERIKDQGYDFLIETS